MREKIWRATLHSVLRLSEETRSFPFRLSIPKQNTRSQHLVCQKLGCDQSECLRREYRLRILLPKSFDVAMTWNTLEVS